MNYTKSKKKALSYIILSVLSLIIGIVMITFQDYLSFAIWYFLVMLFIILSLIFIIIYFTKYRWVFKISSILKKESKNDLEDGIDFNNPTYANNKIHCGKNAFYSEYVNILLPYHVIKWIHIHPDDKYKAVFHLENGSAVDIPIIHENLFDLINNYIIIRNPDLLVGDTSHNQKKYYDLIKKRKFKLTPKAIVGIIIIIFGIVLTIAGFINKTFETGSIIVLLCIYGIGTGLIVSAFKKHIIKGFFEEIRAKAQNSPTFNLISKIFTVTNIVSAILLVFFGNLKIEALVAVFMTLYFISVIPFFASIFLNTGFIKKKRASILLLPQEILDDTSYIEEIFVAKESKPCVLVFRLVSSYGWVYMKESVDYLIQADLEAPITLSVGNEDRMTDITLSFNKSRQKCAQTPELIREHAFIELTGRSISLNQLIRIKLCNQTKTIKFATYTDPDCAERYIETFIRRSFNTKDAFKRAKPAEIQKEYTVDQTEYKPVTADGVSIHINSDDFIKWKRQNIHTPQFSCEGVMSLTEKEPTIYLYEDGVKTREYILQVENDEDFTGKFFLFSVRLGFLGSSVVPIAQIDGFISDTPEERAMTSQDIGYRFEGHFLISGGKNSVQNYEAMRGQDLIAKGLKYPGYTTPSNIRLLGICPECKKSFCFHGYAFYMAQQDVAYSDDGLDCCSILSCDIDKSNWTYEEDGKTFRYYNSFNCPHCGTTYIDYKKYPENKAFGVTGCVHIGRKVYKSEP